MLMRDMVSAVHYLHTKCIMHRDLKLENFLFATKSATSPLVLIDFGLSKRFEPGEVLSQRVGSCYYTGILVGLAIVRPLISVLS
jgi:calcium-dependent protein kinase